MRDDGPDKPEMLFLPGTVEIVIDQASVSVIFI